MKKILILAGPTASGKTEVAYEIAKKIPSEIISFDSMQVYRGMPVLTQAPQKIYRGIKTHLVSFVSPLKEYNASLFRKDADILIRQLLKKKKTPLLVGGTGLYLRALLDGLFEAKEGEASKDEALRAQLVTEQEKQGGDFLHGKLKKVDPVSANKIHPNDIRRIVRALEIFYLTKKPFSEQKSNRSGIREELVCPLFLLERDRQELYMRADRRVAGMVQKGLVEEVKKVRQKKLSQTAGVALGIREISAFLDKQCTFQDAIELLKRKTRNYAKRQLSWFRHEKDVHSVAVASHESAKEIAAKILTEWIKI